MSFSGLVSVVELIKNLITLPSDILTTYGIFKSIDNDLIVSIIAWGIIGLLGWSLYIICKKFFIRMGGTIKHTWQSITRKRQTAKIHHHEEDIICGSWIGSSGVGTATGSNIKFDLKLFSLSLKLFDVQVLGPVIVTTMTALAEWDVYQGGNYTGNISLPHKEELLSFKQLSDNTWAYVFPSNRSKITFTLTSETTANVTEEGNYHLEGNNYKYIVTYTLTKRD